MIRRILAKLRRRKSKVAQPLGRYFAVNLGAFQPKPSKPLPIK